MQEKLTQDDPLVEAIDDIDRILNSKEERKELVGSPPTKVIMFVDGLPYLFPIEEFKKRFGLEEIERHGNDNNSKIR